MLAFNDIPARLLPNRKQCSYNGCARKADWSSLFQPDQGIELQNQWLCSEACFLAAAQELMSSLVTPRTPVTSSRTHVPLGLVMLARGNLSSSQLTAALEQQKHKPGRRIGEVLKELGLADETQITRALAEQWSCPVFPLETPDCLAVADQLPLQLMETYRMLPVHFSAGTNTLLLGFLDVVHYSVLYAAEQMLGCRAEPCLIQAGVYDQQIELLHGWAERQVVIETNTTIQEASLILLNYARQLGAEKTRIVRCGSYLWARLEPRSLHLLFRSSRLFSRLPNVTFGQ